MRQLPDLQVRGLKSSLVGWLASAFLLAGCLGGWTGGFGGSSDDSSSEGGDYCFTAAVAPEEPTSTGLSANAVLESWGGTRLGTLVQADPGVAEAVGLEQAPEQMTLTVSLSSSGDTVQDDNCLQQVHIPVLLELELDDGSVVWTGEGDLVWGQQAGSVGASLTTQVGDPAAVQLTMSFDAANGEFTVLFGEQDTAPAASYQAN